MSNHTRRKLKSQAHLAEERFRLLVEGVHDYAIFMLDPNGIILSWNEGARRLKGYEASEIIGRHFSCLFPKEDIERGKPGISLTTAVREGRFEDEGWRVRKDGSRFWASVIITTLRDETGQLRGFARVTRDMTERRRVEEALKAGETRLRDFVEFSSDDWFWETGSDLRITFVRAKAGEIVGMEPSFFVGKRWSEVTNGMLFPEQEAFHFRTLAARRPFWDAMFRVNLPGKPARFIRLNGKSFFDEQGTFCGYRGAGNDITEQEQRQLEHAALSQRLELQFEQMPVGCVITDTSFRVIDWNPAAELIFGLARQNVLERPLVESVVSPSSRTQFEARLSAAATGAGPAQMIVENITKDGREIHCSWINSPLFNAHGNFLGLLCMIQDVTEREAADARLRQSQKMEAIGQLAGGIAHDFNNLLTIIIGSLSLMEVDSPPGEELPEPVREIMKAANHGAALTQRLLAFARRQALKPRPINLNQLITGMEDLIRRTLAEAIEIEMVLAAGLWPTLADSSQVENTLINLAINARDAMPNGGKLMIETANIQLDEEYAARHDDVTPGHYVVLAVTDTGVGMSPEIIEHAFEPFFTTKEVGMGSGLGLSMVYGFAKQSGGHVNIYSEVDHGTTVRLYLPRAQATETSSAQPEPDFQDEANKGRETILVVEDNPTVLNLTTRMLTGMGYTVHAAGDGPSALALLGSGTTIDLLFTDVIIPGGMSGPVLAREMTKRQPGLKVLYTSGYAENAIVHQGRIEEDTELLNKPYKRHELARKIRTVLDKPSSKD